MNYYTGIEYFTLAKPLPGAEVGSTVSIMTADGRECLKVGEIELPIATAQEHPDWFNAVTTAKHIEQCEESLILYFMGRKKCTREEAIATIAKIDEWEFDRKREESPIKYVKGQNTTE